MAEYIGRDEAIRKALEACVKVVGHGISQIEAVDIVDAMETIPAADVVEVVRCKDCVYYKQTIVPTIMACVRRTAYTKPDDYCSQGRKMDGKGEGE